MNEISSFSSLTGGIELILFHNVKLFANFTMSSMRVHLISKQSIEDYVKRNSISKSSLSRWLSIIKVADWERPEDILKTFNSADILGRGTDRVVLVTGRYTYS